MGHEPVQADVSSGLIEASGARNPRGPGSREPSSLRAATATRTHPWRPSQHSRRMPGTGLDAPQERGGRVTHDHNPRELEFSTGGSVVNAFKSLAKSRNLTSGPCSLPP